MLRKRWIAFFIVLLLFFSLIPTSFVMAAGGVSYGSNNDSAEAAVKLAYYDNESNLQEETSGNNNLENAYDFCAVYLESYNSSATFKGWRINGTDYYSDDSYEIEYDNDCIELLIYTSASEESELYGELGEPYPNVQISYAWGSSFFGQPISEWLNENIDIKAIFEVEIYADYTVTANAIPSAGGTAAAVFQEKSGTNDKWQLTASAPNTGYVFSGWRIKDTADILSTDNPYIVTVSVDTDYEAVFEPVDYELNIDNFTFAPIGTNGVFLENATARVSGLNHFGCSDKFSFTDVRDTLTIDVYLGTEVSGEPFASSAGGYSPFSSDNFDFIMPFTEAVTVEVSYPSGEGVKSATKTFDNLGTVAFSYNALGISRMDMPFMASRVGSLITNTGPHFGENITAYKSEATGNISLYAGTTAGLYNGNSIGGIMAYTSEGEYDWSFVEIANKYYYKYEKDYYIPVDIINVGGESPDKLVFFSSRTGLSGDPNLYFLEEGSWVKKTGDTWNPETIFTEENFGEYLTGTVVKTLIRSQSDILFFISDSSANKLGVLRYNGSAVELLKEIDLPGVNSNRPPIICELNGSEALINTTEKIYKLNTETKVLSECTLTGDAAGEKSLAVSSVDLYNGEDPRGILFEYTNGGYGAELTAAYEWNIATGATKAIDISSFSEDKPVEMAYACDGFIYAIAGNMHNYLGLSVGSAESFISYLYKLTDAGWTLCSVGNTLQSSQPADITGIATVNPQYFEEIVNPTKDLTLFVGDDGTVYYIGAALSGGTSGVAALLEALPEESAVTLDDRSAIEEAQSAFNALTAAQKDEISESLKTKLTAALAALQRLIDAQPEDYGHVYLTIENLTCENAAKGWTLGFILEPTLVELEPGDTARSVVDRIAGKDNVIGKPGYISGIKAPLNTGNVLSEFSGGNQSGWMYSVNNSFPSMGLNAYTLHDGDVIRVQYTSAGLGSDIGGGVSGGPSSFADKGTLITAIALVRAMGEEDKYGADYDNAIAALTNRLIFQYKVNEALIPFAGLVKITDHSVVEEFINKISNPVTLADKSAIETARSYYDGLSAEEKALVRNYYKLTDAEEAIKPLVVAKLIEDLPAVDKLTYSDSTTVASVKASYDALSDEHKEQISTALKEKLDSAVAKIAELRNAVVSKLEDIYTSTAAKIVSLGTPGFNSEWTSMGLARSGYGVPNGYFDTYLADVLCELKDKDGNLLGPSGRQYTEYERTIIALTSIGVDVTDVGGYNLLSYLTDYDKVIWQGLNSADFALIALDTHGYVIETVAEGGNQLTRGKLIDRILSVEISAENGSGWALSGDEADPDMTAMTIQALAPYYLSEDKFNASSSTHTWAELKAAVERGITALSAIQAADGGYGSWGTTNSESSAQVIVALTSLNIDPMTDARFNKNGANPVTALLSYYVDGGGFKHTASGSLDGMATEQGYYALAAYYRLKANKTSLYDMSDVMIKEAYMSVESLIDAISDPVTLEDQSKITSARTAYNALNDVQKAKVAPAKLTKLENAEKALSELKIAKCIELINAISDPVTLKDENAIGTARNYYVNELNEAEREKVTNYKKLTDAETALQKLKDEQPEGTTKSVTVTIKGVTYEVSEATKKAVEAMQAITNPADPKNALPEDFADLTEAQEKAIIEAYKLYEALTADEKLFASNFKDFEETVLKKLGETYHYDEENKIDARGNAEDALPWYVKLVVKPHTLTGTEYAKLKEKVGDDKDILLIWDISFVDILTGEEYHPTQSLKIKLETAEKGTYTTMLIVHQSANGDITYLQTRLVDGELEFTGNEFSLYSLVGYMGTWEDLLPSAVVSKTANPWPWIALSAAGICGMAVLLVMKKKRERESYDE